MALKSISATQNNTCDVHGAPSKAANRTLLLMMLACCSLIIWHVWVYGPTNETAKYELSKSFFLLLGIEAWDLIFSGHGILAELWDIFPYFIIGIFLAGYIRTYKISVKLQATLRRYGFTSIFLASLIGLITPLCACGTITTAISLLFAGLPLAPVMALLVTSPLLSPSTYLLTLNDLGPEWTVIRTIAAFCMGMFAGVITHLLRDKGFQTNDLFVEGAVTRGDLHDEHYPDERLRCNCKDKFGNRVAAKTGNKLLIFLAKSSEMLWLVGKYVLVGVAIGTVIERYIPHEWIYQLFGQKNPLSPIWITLGSVPLFLHQISASSILYHIKSSLDGTLDGGAAIAFLIGGPVTAIPTMVIFWSVFRKRVFFLYLFVCVSGTILLSYAFQLFVFVPSVDTGNSLLKNVQSVSGGSASIIQKENKDVRIVMDPGGKSIIATHHNDLEGQGGIVFDSGFERLLNADKYDNAKYISNIAEWLEQSNSFPSKKRILIYDTSENLDKEKNKGITALRDAGYDVDVTDRTQSAELSSLLLEQYGQVWMLFGKFKPGNDLSENEVETISQFAAEGKSILIMTGAYPPEVHQYSAANQVASRYGVSFSGFVEHSEQLPVSTGSYFFSKTSKFLGKILKFMHKA